MNRFDDWRPRLLEFITGISATPFEPGKHDCALFAAGAVKAMTGKDFARGFRGYKTLEGGMMKLRRKGLADHIDLAASKLPEIPPALARVGDVAVVESEAGPALGVVQGENIYVAMPKGLGLVPMTAAIRAFRI